MKNANSQRTVPIHSAVKRAGFLDFVKKAKSGPLFPELKPDRFGNRGGTGTKQLSRWVRSLGITDKRLGPNHSWRHRFKTNGRRYGLAGDLINAMTGHGRKTVADLYGEYPILRSRVNWKRFQKFESQTLLELRREIVRLRGRLCDNCDLISTLHDRIIVELRDRG